VRYGGCGLIIPGEWIEDASPSDNDTCEELRGLLKILNKSQKTKEVKPPNL
jgi:hypothetical protein